MLLIDGRWKSVSGIGRYASEVISRLKLAHTNLNSNISPSSALDIFSTQRLAARKEDIIYTPGFNVGITRARQVITLHDMIHLSPRHRTRAKTAYYDFLVRPAAIKAGLVLTVSETSRAAIVEWLDNDDVEVVNAGNGCSETFFNIGDKKLPSQAGNSYFLYVGNNKPHKNVSLLLDSLKTQRNFRLKIVSQDVEAIQLESKHKNVLDQIDFITSIDDSALASLYRGAIATLMPSTIEGFGLPAVESLASGTPVVYWRQCRAIHEIVGGHGIPINDIDKVDDMASAMSSLSAGNILIPRVSAAWIRDYNWATVAKRVQDSLVSVQDGMNK